MTCPHLLTDNFLNRSEVFLMLVHFLLINVRHLILIDINPF